MKSIIILTFLVLSLFAFTSCNNNEQKVENKKTEIKTEVKTGEIKKETVLTPEENKILDEVVEPLLNVK